MSDSDTSSSMSLRTCPTCADCECGYEEKENDTDTSKESDIDTSSSMAPFPPLSEIPDRGPYGFEENYNTDTSEENNNDTSEENDNHTSEENDTGTYDTDPYIFRCSVPYCEICNVREELYTTPASAIYAIANPEQNNIRTRANLTEAQDRTEQDHRVAFYARPLQTRREVEPHIRFLIRQGIQEAVLRNIARAHEVIVPGRTGRVIMFWDTAQRLIHILTHRTYYNRSRITSTSV